MKIIVFLFLEMPVIAIFAQTSDSQTGEVIKVIRKMRRYSSATSKKVTGSASDNLLPNTYRNG